MVNKGDPGFGLGFLAFAVLIAGLGVLLFGWNW